MNIRAVWRLRPCTCGCGGADPWHQSVYLRKVTLIDESTGTVQLPMSTFPVTVRKSKFGLWMVDRDSVTFNK